MRQHQKFSPALIVPSPALITHFPVGTPNKLAPKVSINIPRNQPLCSFVSFSIVLVTSFINQPEPSRDITILMISFICSLETIDVVNPKPLYSPEP